MAPSVRHCRPIGGPHGHGQPGYAELRRREIEKATPIARAVDAIVEVSG